jgi:uncharacterized protein YkwD
MSDRAAGAFTPVGFSGTMGERVGHAMKLPLRRSSLLVAAVLMAAGGVLSAVPSGQEPQTRRPITAFPTTEEMEEDLLLVLNQERSSQHLTILRLAPELVALAREQSADMAASGVLSHFAASGKSLTNRLVDADVYFAANGENVARSETFVAEFIHQSFMGSPDHRDNILHAEFDTVGVGVVRGAENVYFVTVDFIRSLAPKPSAEVRDLVLGNLNETRARRNRPLVAIIDAVDRMAGFLSLDKAAGRDLPKIPAFFGETIAHFAAGPDAALVAQIRQDRFPPHYGRAGIGVSFARSRDYPGGAYFVCVLCVADDLVSTEPGELTRFGTVLRTANAFRASKGLVILEFDFDLIRQADETINARMKSRASGGPISEHKGVFFSMFQVLEYFEHPLRKRLEDPAMRRIGIATVRIHVVGARILQYAIAIALDR